LELLEMPGAQVEFPDSAGNVETNVPSGYFNVGVYIADHDHPFRHRHLHARRKCASSYAHLRCAHVTEMKNTSNYTVHNTRHIVHIKR
jgi:hypothetical protein